MESLIAATAAFVGLHFLLSHPLRAPLVARIGEGAFLGLYSLVALGTFAWMVIAFRAVEPSPPLLWIPGDGMWLAATIIMWVGSVLFAGSLFANPALPSPGREVRFGEARGVYAVTRHPMMWGFALWALVHIATLPTERNLVLCGGILILALVGSLLQDRKKAALVPGWTGWQARTSWLPFAAQLAGKARWTFGDMRAILGGTALWLIATKLHITLGAAFEAGIWRWVAID